MAEDREAPNAMGKTPRRDCISHLLSGIVIALICAGLGASAQTKQPSGAPVSDLERQNMAHVAARATQLIAIFYRDPGLLVELKRWVAKDAADHGQLVSDTDLTDEAIFNRLETDVIFRSQATLLVQKYGYLFAGTQSGIFFIEAANVAYARARPKAGAESATYWDDAAGPSKPGCPRDTANVFFAWLRGTAESSHRADIC